MTVSPDETSVARSIANCAQEQIEAYLPRVAARATAFGDVLVLEGEADFAHDRIVATRLCEQLPGVERVVNKLHVQHRDAS